MNRVLRACTAVSLLLSAPALAQTQSFKPPELITLEKMDAETAPPTAKISYGADPLQSGELRIPAGKGPFPVAIVIHGGCWMSQLGGTGMQSLSEALRKRGIATWDINYRRVGHPGGGWPGTFQDVAAGIDRLPVLAKKYPLDMSRVTAIGHSAGALFSTWAAARPKLAAPWRASANGPRFVSVVAIDGPSTLAPMVGIDKRVCGQPVIVPLMGGTPAERPAEYKVVSAADHLPLGIPQLLVFAELGSFMQPYAAQAKAAGDKILTLTPPEANHFDIVTPGTPNGDTVIDWIAERALASTGSK